MKSTYKIAALSVVLFLSSCNSIFERIDELAYDNVLTDETLITNLQTAETALNGVYSTWQTIDIGWSPNYLSTLSRTILPPAIYGTEGFATNDVRADNEFIEKNYSALYKVINMANSVLAILQSKPPQDIPPQRLKEMIAEARFHRGLAHMMLLRQYGEFYNLNSVYGIVLYDQPVRNNIPKARASVSDTWNFILADFTAAETAPTNPKGHYLVSKTTALAFKSRTLLNMKKFAEASQAADQTIAEAQTSGYSLESSYLNIFKNQFNSSEVLFGLFAQYPLQPSVVKATNIRTTTVFNNLADAMVPGTGSTNTGNGMDYRYKQVFAKNSVAAEGNTPTGTNKYNAPNYSAGSYQNTFFFMRLAEVYLIKAEADTRLGNYASAKSELNTITQRAGYAPNYPDTIANSNLLEMVYKHKWMELAYENNEDWFDMVRLNQWDGMNISQYLASTAHLCLPIPQSALAGNNLLLQNPGYN